MDSVERRIELPRPPEEVWPALADAARLSEWFGAEVDLEPRAGARATFRWPDGRERGAVVEAVEPGRRLTFRWLPVERWPGGRTIILGPGRVELVLQPTGSGSVLTVTEWGAGRPETVATRAVTRA